MKKTIFTCLVLSALSLTVNAQSDARWQNNATTMANKMTPTENTVAAVAANDGSRALTAAQVKAAEQKAEKNAKALQTKLGLSKEQYAKVLAFEKNYQKEADKWPAGQIPSGHESNITWQKKAQIQSVLNESQAKKYEEMLAAKQ